MAQNEQRTFLVNMKLIYEHAIAHTRSNSKLNRLMALHSCHYVAEQILREKARDVGFNGALHDIGFETIIKNVNRKVTIPDFNRLLELNNDRNDAEHFFNVPDNETMNLYVRVTGDFLKWSCKTFFDIDYETLAFEDMIHDEPIKRVMVQAKELIKKGDFVEASKRLGESLGALKFLFFLYFSDARLEEIKLKDGNSLADLIADLALKILLADDEETLRKFLQIRTKFKIEEGKPVEIQSVYPILNFKDKDEASKYYEEILNIILTYQYKVPPSLWRKG